MAPTIANIRLGQCVITYDGVDLGYTNGGVEVTVKNDVQEVMIDEYGSAPIRTYHKGTRIEVKAKLSEYAYATLVKVINGAVLNEGNTVDEVTIGQKAGIALAGALLKLHPSLVSGTSQDVELYKAIVIGESKFPFKLEGETTYEVTWVALIDESKANGSLLARLGIA